ncbi:MAG: hypothetical protein D4R64_18565 [Porphyromonadaceae bacterium]|nr:MAG: hypothetical protein D4R64_18565 [Porphyromonadaceae bacterium]
MKKIMNLGFIGIGKIASAVIEGLCTSKIENAILRLSPGNEENSRYLAKKYSNVTWLESNQDVPDQSEVIFIALRPPQAEEILTRLTFKENQIIISLILLLKYSDLSKIVAPATTICRAIP